MRASWFHDRSFRHGLFSWRSMQELLDDAANLSDRLCFADEYALPTLVPYSGFVRASVRFGFTPAIFALAFVALCLAAPAAGRLPSIYRVCHHSPESPLLIGHS
jgi:hypothetical protein